MFIPYTAPVLARHRACRHGARLVLTSFVATLSAALCGGAGAANSPLTLQEAQLRAVERSRLLAAKDYAVHASREQAVAAGRLPDPILKLGVDNVPVEGPDRFSTTRDFMTQRRIGLMQDLTRADKRRLRAERFEREADKTSAEKTAAAAAIERDTAVAWLERYYAEAMAGLVAEQEQQAGQEVAAAEAAYRGGRGAQADVFSVRGEAVALADRARELGRRVANAKLALARWIGEAAQLPLAGKPVLDAVPLELRTLETQLGHHPEIAVLRKQEDIAATEAALARADKKPDWSVEVAFQQRGHAYSNMLSVGVSVPLQWNQGNRQDREVSARLAQLEQAKAESEDALRAHVAEVGAMLNEWQSNRERQTRLEQDLLPLARSRTTSAVAQYRGGKTSLADVLAARRSELDARLQVLQLEADTGRLWAQLRFLVPAGRQHNANPGTDGRQQ
ncbi:TolC family protein [Massilia jejuensis]|uniref:TolC family protein n=1 Tax=Massilia jejuensis TaxID=648894 RepID=A0ABW0PFX3_9BURK